MLQMLILGLLVIHAKCMISEGTLERFNIWIKKYDIKITEYSLSTILNNWIINDNYINEINNKNLTYKLDHNLYSGYSKEDFEGIKGYNSDYNIVNNKLSSRLRGTMDYIEGVTIINYEKSIDWRLKNAVNDIKNQGECKSSWAFSAISSLESAYALKYNKLINFSEQFLIDSDYILKGGYNCGCDGGSVRNTYRWLKKKGTYLIQDYEYYGRNSNKPKKIHNCDNACTIIDNTTLNKYVLIQTNLDDAMLSALNEQPVSVSIDASTRDFYLYSSGLFTASCGINLNHAVNLVGYGSSDDGDYYILRNSWGTSWGDEGYMYLPRGDYNNGAGQCGVLLEGIYPILK